MKKLYIFLFILIFTISTGAQEPAKSGESKTAADDSVTVKSGGKFNLPPEKTRPVTVARFDAAPVIDGRLDDEAWKSAPVLKDFYQVSPGV